MGLLEKGHRLRSDTLGGRGTPCLCLFFPPRSISACRYAKVGSLTSVNTVISILILGPAPLLLLRAKVLSCNAGRGATSWEFYHFCITKDVDVIYIQEVGLRQSELHALMRAAERASYRVYLADCRHKPRQSWGGVLLLVHTRLRSCQLEVFSQDDGQAVTVLIEDVALTSCYQPPNEPRMPLNSHQLEMAHLVPPSTPWVCLGDHNDEPSEHPVLQAFENDGYRAVCARNQDGSLVPTRWGGSRCIDYAITSTDGRISKAQLLDDAFADHFVFACEIKLHNYCSEPQSACFHHRTNDISRPKAFCKKRWQELCREEFSRLVPLAFPETTDQEGIDSLWSAWSLRYEMASRFTKRRALQEALDSELPNFDNRPHKGNFVLKTTAPQTHPELKVGDSFRLRKLRNVLARLREMQKLERLGKQLTGEYLNLQAKIRQSPLVLNGSILRSRPCRWKRLFRPSEIAPVNAGLMPGRSLCAPLRGVAFD